jgi:hypothetical protein
MKMSVKVGSVITAGCIIVTTIGIAAECLRAIVTESDVTRQVEDTPPTNNWVLYTRAGTAMGSWLRRHLYHLRFRTVPRNQRVQEGRLAINDARGWDAV